MSDSSEEGDAYNKLLSTLSGGKFQELWKKRKLESLGVESDEEEEESDQGDQASVKRIKTNKDADSEISFDESDIEGEYENDDQDSEELSMNSEEDDENKDESSNEESQLDDDEEENDGEEEVIDEKEENRNLEAFRRHEFDVDEATQESDLRTPPVQIKTRKGFEQYNVRSPAKVHCTSTTLPHARLTLPKWRPGIQSILAKQMLNYKDIYYSSRTFSESQDLRSLYVFHSLNHVLWKKQFLQRNNRKLAKNPELGCRDQGFTKAKVLVVLPFRRSCYDYISYLTSMLPNTEIQGSEQFKEEFGSEEDQRKNKPEEWNQDLAGNIDEDFCVGIKFFNSIVRLFSNLYTADILVASPLGLRRLIGAPGEKDRDFDYLSSIEMIIFDEAHIFHMQNFDHITIMFEYLNCTPVSDHNTNFARVKQYFLNQWSKYFRQTIIISKQQTAEWNALFKRYCFNVEGSIHLELPTKSSMSEIVSRVQQVFLRLECATPLETSEVRVKYFIDNVLNEALASMHQTVIYIPHYVDYVALRNHLREQEIEFVALNEYNSQSITTRARHQFSSGAVKLMLFTERFHFYRRFSIRGIQTLFFLSPPLFSNFYRDMINFLSQDCQCTLMFTKWDVLQLERILDPARAQQLIESESNQHLFI